MNYEVFKAVIAGSEKDPCVYCGGTVEAIDHIVPVSKNGPNDIVNYAPICCNCNLLKGSFSILYHLHRLKYVKKLAYVEERRKANFKHENSSN